MSGADATENAASPAGSCCGTSRGCCGGMLTRAMAIVLIGSVAGAVHSWHTPVSLRLESAPVAPVSGPASGSTSGPSDAPGTTAAAQAVQSPTPLPAHLSLAQAKEQFDLGASFVDAREEHERGEGWIAGSVHLTAGMMSGAKLPEAFELLNPDGVTVIYCAGGTCDASENLAILLKQAGFTKLHIFHDGFPAWKQAGYPIETAGGGS